MKKLLIVSFLFIFAGVSAASALAIHGKVIDSKDKTPLSGVNIVIEGSNIGVATDFDGNYLLENERIEVGDKLKYSYVGYDPQEKIIKNDNQVVNVEMVEKGEQLAEVVVTAKKSKGSYVKGAVKNIKDSPLKNVEVYSPEINKYVNMFIDFISLPAEKKDNVRGILPKFKGVSLKDIDSKESLLEKLDLIEEGSRFYKKTDEYGEFIFNLEGFPSKKYTLIFSYKEGDKIYKDILRTVDLENEDRINLEIVMYYKCSTGGQFDSDCLFPAWASKEEHKRQRQEIRGILGKNKDDESGGEKIALSIIPNIINIILKFISPIVVIMFIYAGVKFIYAGSDEEDITSAKDFFLYAGIGLAFIIMSYTLMKVIYFFLK